MKFKIGDKVKFIKYELDDRPWEKDDYDLNINDIVTIDSFDGTHFWISASNLNGGYPICVATDSLELVDEIDYEVVDVLDVDDFNPKHIKVSFEFMCPEIVNMCIKHQAELHGTTKEEELVRILKKHFGVL